MIASYDDEINRILLLETNSNSNTNILDMTLLYHSAALPCIRTYTFYFSRASAAPGMAAATPIRHCSPSTPPGTTLLQD